MSSALPAPSMIVVFSFEIWMRLAVPKSSNVAVSSERPTSSEITVPPVRTAMSCNIALRRSPKPGALTAATLTMPRMLFTTNVAKASPSTSSAINNNGLPAFATPSRTGIKSRIFEIFLSTNSTKGSSNSAVMLSWLLTK